MLKMKRVYEAPEADDGVRILVERLWPRGLSKEKAKVDEWDKELSPSTELRKWYGHDPAKWEEFKKRYLAELEERGVIDELTQIGQRAQRENVTLVFAASDEEHSNAAFLKELLVSAR